MNFMGNSNNAINGTQMPQISQEQVSLVKDLLTKKGISAETWVRQICTMRGINVDDFMKQFKDVSL